MSSHRMTGREATGGPLDEPLRALEKAAQRAARRLGWGRWLAFLVRWSPAPLLLGVVALGYLKLGVAAWVPLSLQGLVGILVVLGGVTLAVLVGAIRAGRAGPTDEGALALDRHHGLDDRLTTALAFRRKLAGGASEATGLQRSMMELAIADAVERAPQLDPQRAVPARWPAGWELPSALVVGLSVLGVLEVRPAVIEPAVEPPPPVGRVALFEDDVELLRELGRELEEKSETPEAQAQVRTFNRLVEELAAQELDRRQAFARLDALERAIRGSGREVEDLEQALAERARELEGAALSRAAGEALADKRLADAEQALRQLAERLRHQEAPPSKAELEQLRKALEKASKVGQAQREQQQSERSSLEAERQRLLQKKKDGTATPQELKALEHTERRLERLGRQNQKGAEESGAAEQLSELDRQLSEAARELAEAQGKSSEFVDQSAESVRKMKQKQLSQKEKQELLERMREMRDMLRQQKGGQEQQNWAERMRRLQRKAQGGGEEGEEGEGKPGKPGAPRPGGVTLGPDGKPIPMAGAGQMPGSQGGQKDGAQGQQPGGTGEQPGSGHDPSVKGETARTPEGKTEDVAAVARDTGQGTASSEVIYSAAQRGFASGEYGRVYTDYKNVAEDVIEREGIPPGYKSHVRRYFQLIRPRE